MSAALIPPNQDSKVVSGVFHGQYDRTEELNDRLYKRNLADHHLENWFSPRAHSTKYSRFPMTFRDKNEDSNAKPPVLNTQPPTYNVAGEFAPTTRTPPFRGYSENVNIESSLRNQFYALQKSDQAVYVPSSLSDLYHVKTVAGYQCQQTHPLLFDDTHIPTQGALYSAQMATAGGRIGGDRFYNYTRTQLRGLN